jgi:hypothetical protein
LYYEAIFRIAQSYCFLSLYVKNEFSIFETIKNNAMKRYFPLLLVLAIISIISGILLSEMSFLAKTAISIFKKEYQYYAFMKIWWQAAMIIYSVFIVLLLLQLACKRYFSPSNALIIQLLCLLLAGLGFYLTYIDFHTDLSHRWAGKKLHAGFYLFWMGWALISLFLLFNSPKTISKDNTDASSQ